MKLIVEGWRSLDQSFAIVNQWQLLALSRRDDVTLRTLDMPFFRSDWRKQDGIFPPDSERIIQAVPPPEPAFTPDITWRMDYPYNFAPAPAGRTVVFGTSETQTVTPDRLRATPSTPADIADPRVTVVTPSQWSAVGFHKLGFDKSRVAVIPHGVEPQVFRPRPEARERLRRQFGLAGFIFLHIGAMTPNKGMDVLLRAFAAIAQHRPEARLLLKGSDALYASGKSFRQLLAGLTPDQAELVQSRTTYKGESLSMEQVAGLYQIADAYVSPYRAEGFNMPALEAAGCGLPVICTRGGSTDDFVTGSFARGINSTLRPIQDDAGVVLMPDQDHLTQVMLETMDDQGFRDRAAVEGPRHVNARFTWDHVADQMVRHMRGLAASR